MYLHKENKNELKQLIDDVSRENGMPPKVIEKDYYNFLILRLLVEKYDGLIGNIVFKGGTSLSKAFHVIDRFSEDIDITFTEHIGENRRKKLKYMIMKPIGEELGLNIENFDQTESDKDYNHYDFHYESCYEDDNSSIFPWVKVETALMSYSYPTEKKVISNYLFDLFGKGQKEWMKAHSLLPFEIRVQSLERTFIDKMFAVCDYYINNKSNRNSRHLYDIYKISSKVNVDKDFKELAKNVRLERQKIGKRIAPSAFDDVNLIEISNEIKKSEFYKEDFERNTSHLISDNVKYENVIDFYLTIMNKVFGEK